MGEVNFKDEDGNIVKTEQNENKVDGRDGDEYTTEKNEKDGFKFVKTQDPKDNPTYSTDGKSTTGKIVGNKDQSITYVYEKVVKKEKTTPCPVCPTPKPEPKPEPKKLPQSGYSEEGYALGMAMLGLSGLMTIVDIKRKNEK